MTLQRRIAGAVALGVAGLVIALATIGYVSVRSYLHDEIDRTLGEWGRPFTDERVGPPRPARGLVPAPEPFGGASGYFQFVRANGTAFSAHGPALLQHNARVRQIAQTGRGSTLVDETVLGTHLRVLTVPDPDAHIAVQIARPLTEADSVLHDLLITYAIVIGVGVALALWFGARIGRVAIAPIVRFTRRSESITGILDGSQRIEVEGVEEVVRLASSFNRMLDALENSIRSQRNLIADASHELRTPISALRANIQIFLESDRLPAGERVGLQRSIVTELDELTQLVADVVELAREHDQPAEVQRLRLDQIVSAAVLRARRRAPDLEFVVELPPTVIEHSLERVEHAVSNLLDNASKWSPSGGIVEVRLDGATLAVRDHGSGFQEADLPFVFDRFYRAQDARRLPGSGLGLAIVRQAAEAYGGRAEALNAPGGGALLRVTFDSRGDAPPPPSGTTPDPQAKVRPRAPGASARLSAIARRLRA